MKIRLGVQLHPQHCTYDELAAAAREVDELGFDTLFTWDHFYPLYGVPGAPLGEGLHPAAAERPLRGNHFEAWTLMASFATLTKRVEIGALVACNSYRNPQLLADMVRTIDHISHGRFFLGIGSGWYEQEYLDYGYEFGTAGSRLDALARDLPIIKDRLAKVKPAPTRRIPILIGGGGEKKTLRITGEHADMWNFYGSPAEMKHKISILDGWCREAGRDPAAVEKSVLLRDPAQLNDLDAYRDIGVSHFIWGTGYPFDMSAPKQLMQWRERLAVHP